MRYKRNSSSDAFASRRASSMIAFASPRLASPASAVTSLCQRASRIFVNSTVSPRSGLRGPRNPPATRHLSRDLAPLDQHDFVTRVAGGELAALNQTPNVPIGNLQKLGRLTC
jgi:hypothetical protein